MLILEKDIGVCYLQNYAKKGGFSVVNRPLLLKVCILKLLIDERKATKIKLPVYEQWSNMNIIYIIVFVNFVK